MPTLAYISLDSESEDVDGVVVLKKRFLEADGVEQRDLLQDWIATLQALNDLLAGTEYADDITGNATLRLSADGTKLIQSVGRDRKVIWEGTKRSGS